MDIDEIKSLTRKLLDNPVDTSAELDDTVDASKLLELKKQANPLGTVTASKKSCCVMSVFNMNESYRKKLLTTSLIAFTYRLLEEYEPETELARAKLWRAECKPSDSEYEERCAEITATSRRVIRAFLDRHFEFNPDKHILQAHKKSEIKDSVDLHKIKLDANNTEEKLQKSQENVFAFLRANTLSAQASIHSAINALKSANIAMLDETVNIDDKRAILIRSHARLSKINEEFVKITDPLRAADTMSAWEVNPPKDVFYHFDRYVHNHYEKLREITDELYTDQCEIDDIVINYDSFVGDDCMANAKDFVAQHHDEFKQEPIIIENSGITLFGPFKENRAKINYYNKDTQILQDMTEQVAVDQKLGKDIIEKKVRDTKKKNIAEQGPDAPGLAAYRDAMSNIERLGAKKGLNQQEQDEYARSIALKEDAEVPDGAIQTDVFFTDDSGKLSKTKMYSQCEAPLHLQKGSPFVDKYQPKK